MCRFFPGGLVRGIAAVSRLALLALLVLAVGPSPGRAAPGADAAVRPTPTNRVSAAVSGVPGTNRFRWERNIPYARAGSELLRLDLARPVGLTNPCPALVMFHGGPYHAAGRTDFHEEAAYFAARGYVAATVTYRGPPKGTFPEGLLDARAAVRFLRANAARYQIRPERIGAYGGSMGGWIALLLGMTSTNDVADSGPHPGWSSRVQAVVDRYGPTDLTAAGDFADGPAARLVLFGMTGTMDPASDTARDASPLHYVTPDDPPVLIQHNPRDSIVPIAQSRRLVAALEKARVPVTLELFRGTGHATEWAPVAAVDWEDRRAALRRELEFLERHLKGARGEPGRRR